MIIDKGDVLMTEGNKGERHTLQRYNKCRALFPFGQQHVDKLRDPPQKKLSGTSTGSVTESFVLFAGVANYGLFTVGTYRNNLNRYV